MKNMITTGVIHQNECGEFISDEMMNSICLEYEEHCRECEEEYHDSCWTENGDETELINFLYDEKTEKYIEDEGKEYSAIYHNGVMQITRSDHYCLPAELMPEDCELNILETKDEEEIDALLPELEKTGLFWQDTVDRETCPYTKTEKVEKVFKMLSYLNSDESVTSDWNSEKVNWGITEIREKIYAYEYGMIGEIEYIEAERLQEEGMQEEEAEKEAERIRKIEYIVYPLGQTEIIFLKD